MSNKFTDACKSFFDSVKSKFTSKSSEEAVGGEALAIEGGNTFFDKVKAFFKPKRSLDKTKARAGYFFVLPFLLGIVLIYLPILFDSIWYSFTVSTKGASVWDESLGQYVQTQITTFVGFDNYVQAFSDQEFYEKLLSSLQQILFQVPAIVIFSLFIAVVLNQKMLGRAVFRAIFFVPVIISTGVMEIVNLNDSLQNSAGEGIDDGTGGQGGSEIISMLDVQALFANMKIGTELVTYVVGLVNDIYSIINYSGVQMLIFLAGLQSISPSIYEACQIEGATGWETFWKVTFPMISPMILVNAIYTVIDAFTRTNNPAMNYASNQAYHNPVPGVGVAMSWIYFLLVALIIAVVGAIASSFVFYQRRD